jgi:hypothetical protein
LVASSSYLAAGVSYLTKHSDLFSNDLYFKVLAVAELGHPQKTAICVSL